MIKQILKSSCGKSIIFSSEQKGFQLRDSVKSDFAARPARGTTMARAWGSVCVKWNFCVFAVSGDKSVPLWYYDQTDL